MAKLKKRNKGTVPTIEEASSNLGEVKEVMKGFNFKVNESFYKEYKRFAFEHDMSLTTLLKVSFEEYKKSVNT